jgi:hypothetical protein
VRTNIALAALGTLTAFLLATNPVVADTARTITGKQIKNDSVTGKDIKDTSLSGADVQDDSLTGADINESTLEKVTAVLAATTADTANTANTANAVAPNSITSESVVDRSLRAVDVSIASGTANVDLPNLPTNDCAYAIVPTGVPLDGAAVAVSAGESAAFANGGLAIHAAKSNIDTSFRLVACNLTAAAINPDPAPFDYVVFR